MADPQTTPKEPKAPYVPPVLTCPKCGEQAVAFVCDSKGCPMNGGAAYG